MVLPGHLTHIAVMFLLAITVYDVDLLGILFVLKEYGQGIANTIYYIDGTVIWQQYLIVYSFSTMLWFTCEGKYINIFSV